MKTRRYLIVLLVLAMLAGVLSGCGSSKSMSMAETFAPAVMANGSYDSAAMESEMGYESTGSITIESGSAITLPANRKFIVTVRMSTETEDLDGLLSVLEAQIAQLSGYVENQSIRNGSSYASRRYRNADMTIRIPVEQLDSFTRQVSEVTNVVSSSRSTEDVTLTYVDTQSRITALKTEQTRLLELLSQAGNMSDLLEIEARLTEVRTDLEQYGSYLRLLDNQVDYATIHLSVEEVKEYTPAVERSRWEQICDGFVTSVKDLWGGLLDFLVWLIVDIPYLLALGIGVFLVVFLWKKLAARRRKARARRLNAQYQATQQKKDEQE